jgi:DNA-binding NtrC family response regulator
VLVVEDERRLRELLGDVIPQMGFATRVARSAEEARVGLGDHPAEIVVLDLQLPGQSGLDFLEWLRAGPEAPEVIIVTAHGDLRAAQRAIRHGVADFLTKPAPLGELEAALERARRRLGARRDRGATSAGDSAEASASGAAPAPAPGLPLAELERLQILAAIDRHAGNRTAAAAELGISRRTLHYRLAEYRERGLPGPRTDDER